MLINSERFSSYTIDNRQTAYTVLLPFSKPRLQNSFIHPKHRGFPKTNEPADLLTYSITGTFPSVGQWLFSRWHNELTAAGTVQVSHLIPFSSRLFPSVNQIHATKIWIISIPSKYFSQKIETNLLFLTYFFANNLSKSQQKAAFLLQNERKPLPLQSQKRP